MQDNSTIFNIMQTGSYLFAYVIGFILVLLVIIYIIDITQTKSTLRRNYPVIARFRYFFEHLGTFFRQYFFAMDREEMPFNRAERSWIYQTSKKQSNNVSFGSTKDLRVPGVVYFVNCMFPSLGDKKDVKKEHEITPVIIGKNSKNPYSAKSIINISAMSFGALSAPAVTALSMGASKSGCWLNTGEGGLSPYHLEGGADIIFQIGTAKFGVRDDEGNLSDEKLKEIAEYQQVKMFEIKLSQGAKPGKGGILPGAKVTEEISRIRGIKEGKDAISPNRFPEASNISELLDLVNHVRDVTEKPTGFKTVIGQTEWLDEFCEEVKKRGIDFAPDFITIDSGTGGTGAAPMSLIDNMGMPIRESLPIVVDKLIEAGLRERIKIIASGKLVSPSEISWALCIGADFINSARGFMFALGCIQAMKCGSNTCPTGITTHDKKLQKGLDVENKSTRVYNYVKGVHKEISVIAHSCGASEARNMQRNHARMVIDRSGNSKLLSELYPNKNNS